MLDEVSQFLRNNSIGGIPYHSSSLNHLEVGINRQLVLRPLLEFF